MRGVGCDEPNDMNGWKAFTAWPGDTGYIRSYSIHMTFLRSTTRRMADQWFSAGAGGSGCILKVKSHCDYVSAPICQNPEIWMLPKEEMLMVIKKTKTRISPK